MNKMKIFQILFIIMNEFMLPCILKRLCIFKNVQLYYQKGVIRKGYTFFCFI